MSCEYSLSHQSLGAMSLFISSLLRLEVARVPYLQDIAYHSLDIQLSIHLKKGTTSTRNFVNDSKTNLKDVTQAVDIPNGLQYSIRILRTLGYTGPQSMFLHVLDRLQLSSNSAAKH